MRRTGSIGVALGFGLVLALGASRAQAETVCGTVDDFNQYMADNATVSDDVTLTFDVVGVNPDDFAGGKGALAQFRNTTCTTGGQDAVIKVYGTHPGTSHPTGTLKMEYGNACCGTADCGEHWADPNTSAQVFANGTEQCNVTMWIKPDSVGYKLVCGANTFDAVAGNPVNNKVNQIAILEYFLSDGGTTWELPNATASNVKVCYVTTGTPVQSTTVPVAEDVTTGPSHATAVFPDATDLAVEAADNQAYLKFVVPASVGTVSKAVLVMHTRTESYSNGDGGEVYTVSDSSWSENTLTWNTKPPAGTTSLGRIGPAQADQSVTLDISSAIKGAGTYSFAVVSPATDGNGTHFFSKEGSATNGPYLKLTGDGVPTGNTGGTGGSGATGSGGSGVGGSGGITAMGGAGTGGGGGVNPNVSNDGAVDPEGCGCSVRPTGHGWLAAVIGAFLLGMRRRRQA